MIILKYQKVYPSSLAGHVDTLRTVNHILRRAKCRVDYSKGFNPHMELVFSPALSVGIESQCEYVAVSTDDLQNIVTINKFSPSGIVFSKWWHTDENVNLPAVIDSAVYTVECQGIGQVVSRLNITESFVMTVPSKKGDVEKDIAERIFAVKVLNNDNVEFTLACGNTNLRCDLLVNKLRNDYNLNGDYKIMKTHCYVNNVLTDYYLDSLSDVKDNL